MRENPFGGDLVRLRGERTGWRRRVGSYRVFFDIDPDRLLVAVVEAPRAAIWALSPNRKLPHLPVGCALIRSQVLYLSPWYEKCLKSSGMMVYALYVSAGWQDQRQVCSTGVRFTRFLESPYSRDVP